ELPLHVAEVALHAERRGEELHLRAQLIGRHFRQHLDVLVVVGRELTRLGRRGRRLRRSTLSLDCARDSTQPVEGLRAKSGGAAEYGRERNRRELYERTRFHACLLVINGAGLAEASASSWPVRTNTPAGATSLHCRQAR